MTGRSRYRIVLSDEERVELEHRAASDSRPYRDVQRAKLVLYAAEGLTNSEIAGRLGVAPEVVGRWRRRFYEQRLEGLRDRKPAGRARRFPPGGRSAGQGDRVRAAQGATPPAVTPP
jgi:transposase-like protein